MLLRLLAIALLLAAAPVAAKERRITSAYTKVEWERCEVLHSGQQLQHPEDWESRRCEGYAGIPIFWDYGDVRDDIDVGTPNDAGIISGPPHGLGKTLEWRLVDGRPFAIIYRVDSQSTGITWARLIVETIGGPGKPGCPIAKFDALKPNANVAARRAADVVLTGKAHCIDFDE